MPLEFTHSLVHYEFYCLTVVQSVNFHYLIAKGFHLGVLSYQIIFFCYLKNCGSTEKK